MSQMRPSAYVYRAPGRNAHGDPVDADGNVVRPTADGLLVGVIKNVMVGSLAVGDPGQQTIGIPNVKRQVQVQFGDRLVINGVKYQVDSGQQWNYPHSLTSTRPKYFWVEVELGEFSNG